VFNGASAILPVRIEEGPLYRVGEVSVEGAASRSADEVRATFGLSAGSVYRPASVEPARRKVESDYLSRGYNKVRVRTTVRSDPAQARVDLSLTIDAGPQQVLESIDVGGRVHQ
jgi:outer membrane protein assembly factor BamA